MSVLLLGACDGGEEPGGTGPDGEDPDETPTFVGAISVHDVELLGSAVPPRGGIVAMRFAEDGAAGFTELVGQRGSLPCYAVRRDVTNPDHRVVESNQGPVTIAPSVGSSVVPPCVFTNGAYQCVGASGADGQIAPVAGQAISQFTASGQAMLTSAEIGRYLVYGTGTAVPIVGLAGVQTIVLAGEITAPATGAWTTRSGMGLVPFSSDAAGAKAAPPPFFVAGATVDIAKPAGVTVGAIDVTDLAINDAWVLDAASAAALATGLLQATGAVRLGCNSAGTGADCGAPAGAQTGTVVTVETTDANLASVGPTDFPPATVQAAGLTCTALDAARQYVEVPPGLITVLNNANPTRIKISIVRSTLSTGEGGSVHIAAGRGFVTFEDAR